MYNNNLLNCFSYNILKRENTVRNKNTAPGQRGGITGKGVGEDTDNEMIPQTEDEKSRIKSNQRDFNRII